LFIYLNFRDIYADCKIIIISSIINSERFDYLSVINKLPMKKQRLTILIYSLLIQITLLSCKDGSQVQIPIGSVGGQIIADHTVVERYDDIPVYYMNEVKKMLFIPAGESHSNGYLGGLALLEALAPEYDYDGGDGVGGPDPFTDRKLRAERAFWGDYSNPGGWITMYGEEDWFTNQTAIERTKAGWDYLHANGWQIAATGLVWCWDMFGASSSMVDPVYGCHWFGATLNGPDGPLPWGLDSGDKAMTGNSVSMDTYLSVNQSYADYCKAKGYSTKIFFTTGPCDQYGSEEEKYQAYIKYEHIRNFVKADSTRILFDYADILCYNDDGTSNTVTWNGKTFPWGTDANTKPEQMGHISNAGALRLGKAIWWMLARIAGWDGN